MNRVERAESFEHLRAWVCRTETRHDSVTRWPVTALAATVDDAGVATEDGMPLPPGWHWLFFLEAKPPSKLGTDGHPMGVTFCRQSPSQDECGREGVSNSCEQLKLASKLRANPRFCR